MKDAEFSSPYIKVLNDPVGSFARIRDTVSGAENSLFLLCTGSTKTSDCEGISAAGASPDDRRLTPALDAEALITGRTFSAASLPVSPDGIASPVVISRAIIQHLKMQSAVVDAGCFVSPKIDCLRFAGAPAECLSTGAAMNREFVDRLFEKGIELGKHLSFKHDFLVLAECVPAGTTTALAVLKALGHEVDGMTSSSLPTTNHGQKLELVLSGLAKSGFSAHDFIADPLLALAAVGDPVQASLAGIVIGASQRIPILMGGGSQMLAIWALVQRINEAKRFGVAHENLFVLTTKWVGFDPSAAIGKLASMLGAPLAVACPQFRTSKHVGLRAYEDGHVKEGAGAGAALCLAFMREQSHALVMETIDAEYDRLFNQENGTESPVFFNAPSIVEKDGSLRAPDAILSNGSFAPPSLWKSSNKQPALRAADLFSAIDSFV